MIAGRRGSRRGIPILPAAGMIAMILIAIGTAAAFQGPGDDSIISIPVAWFHILLVMPVALALVVRIAWKRPGRAGR